MSLEQFKQEGRVNFKMVEGEVEVIINAVALEEAIEVEEVWIQLVTTTITNMHQVVEDHIMVA